MLSSALLLVGCNILGAAAAKMPKPDIDAAYKGMAGQKVGVMVWADRTLRLDWPSLQIDLGNSLEKKIKDAQRNEQEEFIGTTFPNPAVSYVRYQMEHPEIEGQPITEVAAKLGVTRLIYVEVIDLTTRPEGSIGMFRGDAEASMKVVEVEGGRAKIAYEDNGITAEFPRTSPKEGTPRGNDRMMYVGVIDSLTTQMAVRFFKHPDLSD